MMEWMLYAAVLLASALAWIVGYGAGRRDGRKAEARDRVRFRLEETLGHRAVRRPEHL